MNVSQLSRRHRRPFIAALNVRLCDVHGLCSRRSPTATATLRARAEGRSGRHKLLLVTDVLSRTFPFIRRRDRSACRFARRRLAVFDRGSGGGGRDLKKYSAKSRPFQSVDSACLGGKPRRVVTSATSRLFRNGIPPPPPNTRYSLSQTSVTSSQNDTPHLIPRPSRVEIVTIGDEAPARIQSFVQSFAPVKSIGECIRHWLAGVVGEANGAVTGINAPGQREAAQWMSMLAKRSVLRQSDGFGEARVWHGSAPAIWQGESRSLKVAMLIWAFRAAGCSPTLLPRLKSRVKYPTITLARDVAESLSVESKSMGLSTRRWLLLAYLPSIAGVDLARPLRRLPEMRGRSLFGRARIDLRQRRRSRSIVLDRCRAAGSRRRRELRRLRRASTVLSDRAIMFRSGNHRLRLRRHTARVSPWHLPCARRNVDLASPAARRRGTRSRHLDRHERWNRAACACRRDRDLPNGHHFPPTQSMTHPRAPAAGERNVAASGTAIQRNRSRFTTLLSGRRRYTGVKIGLGCRNDAVTTYALKTMQQYDWLKNYGVWRWLERTRAASSASCSIHSTA